MKFSDKDHKLIGKLFDGLKKEIKIERGEVRHELAELLAGADRDVRRLQKENLENAKEVASILERLQQLSVDLEVEHPRASRIAQEISDHLSHMGI